MTPRHYVGISLRHDTIDNPADHLFRLSDKLRENPVDDRLVDDGLFVVTSTPEYYAGIVEFLTTHKLPEE